MVLIIEGMMISLEYTNKKFPEDVMISPGYVGIEKERGIEMYSHIPKVASIIPKKGFFITHEAYAGPHIEIFIHQTENIIDIKSKTDENEEMVLPLKPPVFKYLYEHSVFGMTNKRKATWVEPSLFWMEKQYKQSLFVYLLYCGMQYAKNKNNYQEALESFQFISQTMIAIKRFLFGFTEISKEYIEDNKQWFDLFIGVEDKRVKEMLILPDYDEQYTSCINAIWTA